MIEPTSYQKIDHNVKITISPGKVVRNTALITATVILTKGVADVASELIRPRLARWTRKLEMEVSERARDRITEENIDRPEVENQ